MIKLADKISNVRDIVHEPPKGWSIKRRREYLDWAEAVVGSCRKVNESLESFFYKSLEEGRVEIR